MLKEVSENYLIDMFERATVVTKIRNRVTLMPCDFEAVFKILRVDYPTEIIEARKKTYENSIEGNFNRNNIDILNCGEQQSKTILNYKNRKSLIRQCWCNWKNETQVQTDFWM